LYFFDASTSLRPAKKLWQQGGRRRQSIGIRFDAGSGRRDLAEQPQLSSGRDQTGKTSVRIARRWQTGAGQSDNGRSSAEDCFMPQSKSKARFMDRVEASALEIVKYGRFVRNPSLGSGP
jgi:hypothetical protein